MDSIPRRVVDSEISSRKIPETYSNLSGNFRNLLITYMSISCFQVQHRKVMS